MAAIRCRRAMSFARQHRCTANHPGHDLRPSGAPRRSRARPGRMRRRREGPQWCSACGSLRAVLWCKDLSTHATVTHGRRESKLGHHAGLRTLGDWPSWAAIPRGASAGRILRTRERGDQRRRHARQRHTRQPAPLHRTRHIKGAAARGAQAGARRTHQAAAASGPSRIRQGVPGHEPLGRLLGARGPGCWARMALAAACGPARGLRSASCHKDEAARACRSAWWRTELAGQERRPDPGPKP